MHNVRLHKTIPSEKISSFRRVLYILTYVAAASAVLCFAGTIYIILYPPSVLFSEDIRHNIHKISLYVGCLGYFL